MKINADCTVKVISSVCLPLCVTRTQVGLLINSRPTTSQDLVYLTPAFAVNCRCYNLLLFYGSVSQGLGATNFTNLIG